MKICGKKLLSLALAVVMSGCMVSAYANTVEITNVKVLSGSEDTTGTAFTKDGSGKFTGSLSPEQLLQVTVKLRGDSGAAIGSGDVSFLSYASSVDAAENSTALDNSTIQYVDQKTSDAVANENYRTATITFRPRLGAGSFVAKAGGTDVSAADSFSYEVKAADVAITLDKESVSITEGDAAEFTITNESKPESVTVKNGADDISGVSYDKESGKISVSGLTVGNYTLTISAAGFIDKSVTIAVAAKQEVTEDEKQKITEDLNEKFTDIDKADASGTVTLPKTSNEKEIIYTIKGDAEINEDGVLSIKDNKFAAKVEVSARVGNTVVAENKVVYLVADPNALISYGNMDLKSSADGKDAFGTTEMLNSLALTDADKLSLKAQGLNHVLRNTTPIKAIQSSLDYDMDGTITLSEYRMFKLMLEGSGDFTPEKLNDTATRNGWIAQAKAASQLGE